MSRLTRDGTAEPVSRDQILRHDRGQGNIHFSCSADHVQDWHPYPVDPYSCYTCDHTYIVVVVVVVGVGVGVVFISKTVLTSIQYLSLSYSSRQRNNFRGPKLTQNKVQKNHDQNKKDPEKVPTLARKI